jgi:hypothetical protein
MNKSSNLYKFIVADYDALPYSLHARAGSSFFSTAAKERLTKRSDALKIGDSAFFGANLHLSALLSKNRVQPAAEAGRSARLRCYGHRRGLLQGIEKFRIM